MHIVYNISLESYRRISKNIDNESDAKVRAVSAKALGETGDLQAVKPLIYTLENDLDAEVRGEVVHALGKIGSPLAISSLINTLDNEEEANWRGTIGKISAQALREIGTPEALQAVEAWRKSQQSDDE